MEMILRAWSTSHGHCGGFSTPCPSVLWHRDPGFMLCVHPPTPPHNSYPYHQTEPSNVLKIHKLGSQEMVQDLNSDPQNSHQKSSVPGCTCDPWARKETGATLELTSHPV